MTSTRFALAWTLAGLITIHLIVFTLSFVDDIALQGRSALESLQALPFALFFFTFAALLAAPVTFVVLRLWIRHVRTKPHLEATPLRKLFSLAMLSALIIVVLVLASEWERFGSLELLAELPRELSAYAVLVPSVALAIIVPRFTVPVLRGSVADKVADRSAPAA